MVTGFHRKPRRYSSASTRKLLFPKDRNGEVCKRTKITRALCRKRTGEAVPRAENKGDLKTADHKVLSGGGEFLEPSEKPDVIHTDNSLEFSKSCEDVSWSHCTSTLHRSETNDSAEGAVRRRKGAFCCVVAIRLG